MWALNQEVHFLYMWALSQVPYMWDGSQDGHFLYMWAWSQDGHFLYTWVLSQEGHVLYSGAMESKTAFPVHLGTESTCTTAVGQNSATVPDDKHSLSCLITARWRPVAVLVSHG